MWQFATVLKRIPDLQNEALNTKTILHTSTPNINRIQRIIKCSIEQFVCSAIDISDSATLRKFFIGLVYEINVQFQSNKCGNLPYSP